MVVTGVRLVPEASPSPIYLAVIVGGAAVLALTSVKPVWVIAVAALVGIVVG
jgi:hypothetical protein